MVPTKQILKDLGLRLRAARISAHLTQKELSARTGIGLNTLGNMEKGAGSTSIATWVSVSESLGFVDGWASILAQPVDPFEEYDRRVGKKNIAKTRVRKKNG